MGTVLAILTPLSPVEARAFLADYDGQVAETLSEIVGVPAGTVNSSFALELASGRRFLRIYEEQDREGAIAEAGLLAHLAAGGVATPPPLARRDGSYVGAIHGKPAVLFPWRDGTMRCLRGVTAEDTIRVGRALARVHLAGAGATAREGRFRPRDLMHRLDRIERCGEPTLAAEGAKLRAKLAEAVGARDSGLSQGVIHGDLFRDNVLWDEGGEIAALLDFESASHGPFAFDLMVTILAWCFRDTLETSLARAMAKGYQRERPLEAREVAGLYAEAKLAAIRFTITRITDDAMRAIERKVPPRRDKDWRRFAARLAAIESLGQKGLSGALGLGG